MNRKDTHFEPDPVIEAFKKDVDRTVIRKNLRLSVEQRFEELMKLQQFAIAELEPILEEQESQG